MGIWSGILDLLTRDVSVWGGLRSPLLSWLGSAGLVLFFAWQLARLLVEARRASQPFLRLRPRLVALAEHVEQSDLGEAYDRAFARVDEPPARGETARPGALDLEGLRDLDQAMRDAPGFRRPWVQFRKTLLIEHVPWFKEPRIFSTRRAEEFFTQDAVLGSRIDLGFFGQVPSLITGIGLLLTFVAICVGLSRLHAEGQTITGIQGLINGLAGKFLTSIVGLVCANLFLLLERPVVRRLLDLQGEFLTLVDESFPRRTVEDLLDALVRHRAGGTAPAAVGRAEEGGRRGSALSDRLHTSIDDLSDVVRSLSDRLEESPEAVAALTAAVQSLERSQLRAQSQIASALERLTAFAGPVGPLGGAAPRARRDVPAPAAGARPEGVAAIPPAPRSAWDWARPRRSRRLG